MKRDIESFLKEWKEDKRRLPLLVRGARQVGKTYTINEFGKAHFNNLVEINFEQYPKYKECFHSLDPKEIIQSISVISGSEVREGETLLFLDEIQECPSAITALRYFYEQMPSLHVVGAGSLLEFALNAENFRMPVGRIQNIFLGTLSFIEFLQALGEIKAIEIIINMNTTDQINPAVHEHMLSLVKKYALLGGMPAVISEYIASGNLKKCEQIQAAIIQTYRNDFGKYSSRVKHRFIEKIFFAVPLMVGRKFKYSHVDDSIQSRDLKEALELLEQAGVVNRIKRTSGQGLPLEAGVKEKHFKVAFLDVGLMQHMCGFTAELLLAENLMHFHAGSVAEQFVSQELLANQEVFKRPSLYYWAREARSSNAEVDFVIPVQSYALPVEVKSGKTGRLRSLRMYLEKYGTPAGVRISQQPVEWVPPVLSVPFYAISQVKRLLNSSL